MKLHSLIIISCLAFFTMACQKEYSFEGGAIMATGSIASTAGNCLPSIIGGYFIAGNPLSQDNYIEVTADVISAGSFIISSNTVNGYRFTAAGMAGDSTTKIIRLRGSGTPVAEGTDRLVISFNDSTQCEIAITVYPAGTGNAVFTPDCASIAVNGMYTQGVETTPANNVQFNVLVSTPGFYNITTPIVNNIVFSGSGYIAAGVQQITLSSNGAVPANSGSLNHTVTVGAASCVFPVIYGVGTNPPDGDLTWSFKAGGRVISGRTILSLFPNGDSELNVFGETIVASSFWMVIRNAAGPVEAGFYPGIMSAEGKVTSQVKYSKSPDIFYAFTLNCCPGTAGISTTITTYSPANHLVEGTFYGTAKKAVIPFSTDENILITEGRFKARLP